MESLVYAANGMYVLAYFMTDILRMRILTVAAACCLATYFYCQPEPLMTVVSWNIFFIFLNLFQIARVVHKRKSEQATTKEDSVAGVNRGFLPSFTVPRKATNHPGTTRVAIFKTGHLSEASASGHPGS